MGQVRNSILTALLDHQNQPVPGRTIVTEVIDGQRVSLVTRPDGSTFTVIADVPHTGIKGRVVIQYPDDQS